MNIGFPKDTKVVDIRDFARAQKKRLRAVPSKPRPVPPMPPSAA